MNAGLALAAMSCGSDSVAPGDESDDLRQLFRIHWFAEESFPAGHAFLVDRGNEEPLALTAYHVAAGASTGGPEVQAWLRHPVEPDVEIRIGSRLHIEGARTITAGDSQHDLAAFRVVDWDPTRALQLATDLPSVGDTVWVLAVHEGSGGPDQHPQSGPRRHPARVEVADNSQLRYVYLASANSNLTSGAAVLDRQGRVVGVNVGSLARASGDVAGIAVGVGSIRTLLGATLPIQQQAETTKEKPSQNN